MEIKEYKWATYNAQDPSQLVSHGRFLFLDSGAVQEVALSVDACHAGPTLPRSTYALIT